MASSAVLWPVAFALDGEVDHHDGVFLHDADQHDDADKAVEIEAKSKICKVKQRAKSGGRQTGKNRKRMDEALIQDAQDDVDHQNGHEQQNPKPDREDLKGLRRP